MEKIILAAAVAALMSGCAVHKTNMDCVKCTTHIEDKQTTIDCSVCTFSYDGEFKGGDVMPTFPILPNKGD